MRYSILIDVKKCSGCYSCFLACRDEYCGNDYPGYSAAKPMQEQFWMQIEEVERGEYPKPKVDYIPRPCQHCEEAPCITAALDGAVYRRDDGIVIIDPVKAKGQKEIVNSCPYRVIFWNAALELPQKCTLCAHRLDEGSSLPRCVESCPTGALVFGDLDDPGSEIARLSAELAVEEFHPEFATAPLVRYFGIPRRFVAGEVVLANQTGECATGIEVRLSGNGDERTAETNLFGDFEFEGLAKNSRYQITVQTEGYQEVTREFVTQKDLNLGEIVLQPK